MDFVGELNRYAVLRATERDFAAVKHARDTVDQLLAAFMQFDWRNGNLRRKYDAVRAPAATAAAAPIETVWPGLALGAGKLQSCRGTEHKCWEVEAGSWAKRRGAEPAGLSASNLCVPGPPAETLALPYRLDVSSVIPRRCLVAGFYAVSDVQAILPARHCP